MSQTSNTGGTGFGDLHTLLSSHRCGACFDVCWSTMTDSDS